MERPTFSNAAAVLIDQFSIGQAACARIGIDIYRKGMDEAAPRAFMNLTDPWGPGEIAMGALQTIHDFAAHVRLCQSVIEQEQV